MVRLRIGVNLLYLKPRRVGGSEEYVSRILRAVHTQAADDVAFTLFVNRRFAAAYPDLAAELPTVTAPISGASPVIRIAAESSWLVRETAGRQLDLIHHVANTLPHVGSRPAVLTIHDLQPLIRPRDFNWAKGAYLRARSEPSARRARVITTPSEYVRRLVLDRLGIDETRVIVVPAPLDIAPVPNDDAPDREKARARDAPLFLYPAITHPHKNHRTLIRAFAKVAVAHPEVQLVLTGDRGGRERAVLEEIARIPSHDRVRRLGRIPRTELDELLDRAVALTFPSYHEGYGLPVAEAMAMGCAVIASNTTALPEVLGDAGVLLDPDDVDAWAAAMLHVLEDDGFRSSLVAAGREQARALTPAETARRTLEAYRLAL